MRKRQIFWAIALGAMLAVTGCGDTEDGGTGGSGASAGTGGSAGSGGSAGTGGTAGSGGGSGSFCDTVCGSCAGGTAECLQSCNQGLGQVPGGLEGCPTELDAVGQCLGATDCTNSNACEAEWTTWLTCVITGGLGI